ncbi:MAG: multi-sensor signal transduction histidine kinase [Cyanobacteria bacterium RYN_339]|nr:multi-sensor signal transduction histidine kinase [Cyanobacteria bacterium RYN_339]
MLVDSSPARILVVDDRPENLTAIEATLDGLEAELVRATSGVEALRKLLDHDVALILLDVQMPGMDGYETARLIRERARTAHVPIIFLSAIDRDEHHALRGYDLGAVDFMPKPFNPAVLRAKASVFVELYAGRERLRVQALALQQAEDRRIRQIHHAMLRAEVGDALGHDGTVGELLQECTDAIVKHLGAAFARIWTANLPERLLELQASSGLYTHIDGPHARVPIGKFKIGLIAEELEPHLTNDVPNDPRVGDPAWARREGMIAFAGYPLVVGGTLMGVVAMFARNELADDTLDAMAGVADAIAQGIARKQAELILAERNAELAMMNEELQAQQAELQILNERLTSQNERIEAEVVERTQELAASNEELTAANEELGAVNEELASQGEELEAQYEELEAASRALQDQAKEREELARQQERVRALEAADKAKDQFLGILSHELRTPLNAIQGFGSVLEDGIVGELVPDQARFVAKIMEASDSLLALVNDLLDMSRVQAGKFTLDREHVALPPLCERALAAVSGQTDAKGQRLVADIPADLPTVDADPLRVSQVLTNLVTNAIKFTSEGGTITVRARVDGAVVRFEVSDTGVGIPDAEQARIFLAFTQVDMSDTRQKGGVGLGLSIVKALVEAHGGDVGVSSQVGQGATFWFTLPR